MKEIELALKVNKIGRGTIIDGLSFAISSSLFLALSYLIVNSLIIILTPSGGWLIVGAIMLALIIHFMVHELIIKRLLKSIFFKKRPFLVNSEIKTVGLRMNDSTFPSGHMSSIAAVLVVITWYFSWLWPFALFFLVLMGFSRIHNGMHYLIDVVFGVFFGVAYGLSAIFIFNSLVNVLIK